MAENRPVAFAVYLGVSGLSLAIIANRLALVTLAPSAFFQPEVVADIASQLPYDTEDNFILSAWEYVGAGIPYESVGSDMYFRGGQIECEDCFLPSQVLLRREGNCVAKSAVLVSILANRIPESRLRIMIGTYAGENLGGHAWVELYRNGNWYLLEATQAPRANNPWILAEAAYPTYDPAVMITSTGFECDDPNYCASFAKCNCGEVIERSFARR